MTNIKNKIKERIKETKERIKETKEHVEQNDLIPAISIFVMVVGMPIGVLIGWAFSIAN